MSLAEILLLLFYTSACALLIFRLRFFLRFQLPPKVIVVIFIVKIISGIVYGYFHRHFYDGGDTMQYFADSKIVFDRLREGYVGQYLKLVFGINARPPAADIQPYAAEMSYWNDMSAYFIVRFHSLARLISFGYYSVHVVFYNFLTLIGMLYLFLFFTEIIQGKKQLILIALFFFPSALFWSSGIHKDGASLAALGLLLFFTQQLLNGFTIEGTDIPASPEEDSRRRKNQTVKNMIGLLTGCWVLIVVRNFWMLLLLPALIALVWTMKAPKNKLLKFVFVFSVYFSLASNLDIIKPDWDFLNLLERKQNEFQNISQQSKTLPIPSFSPTLTGVLTAIPPAVSNCLFRPWFTEVQSAIQLYPAIENMLLLVFILIAIIFRKKKIFAAEQSLVLFSFFFAFTIFIVIGITVPILGALIRYKMVGILFLVMGALVIVRQPEWRKK